MKKVLKKAFSLFEESTNVSYFDLDYSFYDRNDTNQVKKFKHEY